MSFIFRWIHKHKTTQ